MLNSVNTNVGAMIALQNLNSTNTELATIQGRINTGRKINSAKDNGAIWAIAQGQRAESQSINAVKESLQRGVSTVDVAMSAGEAVSDLLLRMKEKALAASDEGLSADSRKALEADYVSLTKQIKTVVDNAAFNGVNMLKSPTNVVTAPGTSVKALANDDASSTIDVSGVNLQFNPGVAASTNSGLRSDNTATAFSGATIAGTQTQDQANAGKAKALVTTIDADIAYVSEKLSALGTGSNALSSHLTFMSKLQDSLDAGVGSLVDADLAKESARLQALQTKQQLGVQALSIANQSSGVLLGLFR